MKRTWRGIVLSGLAALLLVLLATCTLTPGEATGYIKLVVGTTPRMVTVTTVDVDEVFVQVYPPDGGDSIDEFSWYSGGPPIERLVPVYEPGGYDISITHSGWDGEDYVEASEHATVPIGNGILSIVHITPGMVGAIVFVDGEEPQLGPELIPLDCAVVSGAWEGWITIPGQEGGWVDIYATITLWEPLPGETQGVQEMFGYDAPGGTQLDYPAFRGFWECDGGIVHAGWTEELTTEGWMPLPWGEIYYDMGGTIEGNTWNVMSDDHGPYGTDPDGYSDGEHLLFRAP